MAKKKKVKQTKKQVLNDLYLEAIGIGAIVLAVIMLGQLGLVGAITKRIFMLIFGEFFWIIAIMAIVHGGKMVVTRKIPNLLSTRQVGVYLMSLALISFSHVPVYRTFLLNQIPILSGIWSYYWGGEILDPNFIVGGGIVGAIIYAIFIPLITWMGLFGLSLIVFIYGGLLFFNLTVKDIYERGKKRHEENQIENEKKKAEKAEKISAKDNSRLEKIEEVENNALKDFFPKKDTVKAKRKKEKVVEVDIEEEGGSEGFKISNFTENIQKESEIKDFGEFIQTDETVDYNYTLPPLELLIDYQQSNQSQRMQVNAKAQGRKLEDTFKNFDVKAKIQEVHVGPAVTRFEVLPDVGVKVSKIMSLTDDIALSLAAKGIRIEAPIPGKSAIGIEVPNPKQALVTFKEILKEVPAKKQKEKLLVVLGRDISGQTIYSPLNKMPHLLVAGATGSGKSVCINTMICSILMRSTPQEVKMLLIDPKKVELNRYNEIPHLLAPVVTDPRLASLALKKVVSEMEQRYEQFSEAGVRNVESYNEFVMKHNEREETLKAKIPYIIVIVDELADLMMVASKEVEESIMRLTQMARAAGIHLVIATQRPSVDVITGVIKANVPSRIAFGVSSAVDSRTILDSVGAEKLLGRGDMLFVPMGASNPMRVQGAFISDDEVMRIVEFIKGQVQLEVKQDFLENIEQSQQQEDFLDDPLMREVLAYIFETKKVSASLLQRRFRIGYNRAARLVEDLETRHLVSPSEGNKAREVLMSETEYHELISTL